MRFENNFEVDAPLERVWETMLDVEKVAPTVPGAQVLERTGEDAYKVAIKVKVGPMSMTYRGDVQITDVDEAAHRAVMRARAKETRGQGTADANVTMELAGADARTAATIVTDVALSGRVASMGRGVIQDVSGRLVDTFAHNLAEMLEGRPAPQPEPAPAPAPAGEPAGAAAEPAAAPPQPEPTPAPPPREDALDLGQLGGAMVADRLSDPRVIAGLVGGAAVIGYVLGRRGR
jgi:uncharacterized protein